MIVQLLLSGKWYLCDPTWASGTPDPETKKFAFNYNNGFFLTNPQLFAVNHFPIDDKWWLLEKSIPSFEEFLASPIIYGKAYKNLIVHTSPKQMHHTIKKHRKISFEYQLKIQIKENDIHFLMDNGYNSKKVKPTRAQVKKNTLLIEHPSYTLKSKANNVKSVIFTNLIKLHINKNFIMCTI